jgi:hypothetical protein
MVFRHPEPARGNPHGRFSHDRITRSYAVSRRGPLALASVTAVPPIMEIVDGVPGIHVVISHGTVSGIGPR